MLEDLLQRRPYNAVTDLIDAQVARGLGDKIAFIDSDRSLSYGELQARSCRFASALQKLGLRPEERLGLLLYDTVDFPVAFWGGVRAGIVVLPLNTLLNAEQYAYILGDSRTAAIVASASLAKTLLPVLDRMPRLRTIVLIGASADDKAEFRGRDVYDFADLLAGGAPDPFVAPTLSDEVAFWMYTSGSTGDPKGVKHIHTTPMAAARLMGQHVIGIREDDVVFSAAKLFFSYGMGNAMAFPISVGATTVLLPQRPTPEAVFDIMRRHQPTIFYGVPTLYASLLAHKDMARGAGSDRLRLCVSAGEALPGHLGERWRAAAGVDVLDGIGSTEMFQTFLSQPAGRRALRHHRQAGAGLRPQDRRRGGPRSCRRRDRRAHGARADRRRRLLEPAHQEPAHLCRRMDFYRRQICARSRAAITITAAAPTTCSR